MEQLQEASRGYGGEVREERGEPGKAGAQKLGSRALGEGRSGWSAVTGRMSQIMKTKETVERA